MRKKSGNILVIFLVVLLAVATSAAGYFYLESQKVPSTPQQPTDASREPTGSAEMSDWKTYTNSQLGFEIKYPSDWYAAEHKRLDSSEKLKLLFDRKPISNEEVTQLMTHGWFEFNIVVRSEMWSEDILNRQGVSAGNILEGVKFDENTSSIINFAGQRANKSFYSTENVMGDTPRTSIVFNYQGYGWLVVYPNNDLLGNHDQIYDQILSTFKFTN